MFALCSMINVACACRTLSVSRPCGRAMCRLSESFREPQAGAARAVTHGSLQHLVTVSVKSLLMNLCIIGLQFLLFVLFFQLQLMFKIISVQWLDICVLDSVILLRSLAPAWHHAAVTGSLTVLPGLSFTSLCLFRNWQSVLLNPSPFPHSAPTPLPSGNPQPVLYL